MNRFWDRLISPIFQKERPKRVVKIGAPFGEYTLQLLNYCHNNNGSLFVIDPEKSLQELPKIGSFDAVLIDGDHNWYTVYYELKCIESIAEKNGTFPLVFLHDTEWPYGRRDVYNNPEIIPPEHRKPFQKKGIVYGRNEPVEEGGFCENANHAIYENGERNGVLTAIEDFLNETTIPLSIHRLTSNNGMGIITEANMDLDTYIEMITKHSGL